MKTNFILSNLPDDDLDLIAPDDVNSILNDVNDELEHLRKKRKKKKGKKGKKAKRTRKKLKRQIRDLEQERDMLKYQLQLTRLNPPREWWQDALVRSGPEIVKLFRAFIEHVPSKKPPMIDADYKDID